MKHLRTISILLAALCAIALSFKGLREPDLWWQIKTGEWIIAHGKVPTEDVFSFTQKGQPWINIKWGFEVVAALVSNFLGSENVFILQGLVLLALLFFLFQLSTEISKKLNAETHATTAFLLLLPLLFISIDYRINGRPEMSSYLLSIVFLWLNLKYRNGNKPIIWWIIPLQCIWANIHEAFAIGVVINLIFLVAAFVEQKILVLSPFQPKAFLRQAAAVILSVLAIFINPYGAKMLLQPFSIFNQVFENKYTTELLSISSHQYWQKEAWLATAWLVAGMAFLLFIALKKRAQFRTLSIGYCMVVIAFGYLATSAFRNIIFLVLVLFPVAVSAGAVLLHSFKKAAKFLLPVSAIALLVLSVSVITNTYYQAIGSRDKFGLEIRPDYNPIGAAEFIIQNKLSGRCFSDYLTSSFLLWKVSGFETFIDLRDLDVFPPAFFNTFTEAVLEPEKFNALNQKYQFEYVVLFRPQYANLHAWLAQGNGFKAVFADAIAVVYVKDNQATPVRDIFQPLASLPTSKTASALNKFLNPFYSNQPHFKNENSFAAASYYLNIQQPQLALPHATQLSKSEESWKGFALLGEIYYQKSFAATKDSADAFTQAAQQYFAAALQQKSTYVPALMGMGTILYKQGFYNQAKTAFEQATQTESNHVNAWVSLAECYKATLQLPESLDGAINCFEKANKLNPNNPNIVLNLGVLYFRNNNCEKSIQLLQKVKNYPLLTEEEKTVIESCLKQCGTTI